MPGRRRFLIAARTPIARPEPTTAGWVERQILVVGADRGGLVDASGRSAGRDDRGKADQRSGRDKCEKSVHLSFSFGGVSFYPKRAIYHATATTDEDLSWPTGLSGPI